MNLVRVEISADGFMIMLREDTSLTRIFHTVSTDAAQSGISTALRSHSETL